MKKGQWFDLANGEQAVIVSVKPKRWWRKEVIVDVHCGPFTLMGAVFGFRGPIDAVERQLAKLGAVPVNK